MKKLWMIALAVGFIGLSNGQVWAADPDGSWKRPNGETAEVYTCQGKLCCKITKGVQPGFEMCNSMSKTATNTWAGDGMKHPEMPGFMTFNGTVTYSGSTLNIKGCALGQAFCDDETWTKLR